MSAVGVTAAAAAPVWLIGSMAVQIRAEIPFGRTRLGLLVAIYFAASAALSVTGGRFVEWIGWRRGIRLASALSILSLLVAGLLAHSWVHLAVAVGAAGFSNAVAQPAANLGLTRVIRSSRQGLAFGVKQSAIPLATLLSGSAVPLVALTVGWRWGFILAAVAASTITMSVPRDEGAVATRVRRRGREGDAPLLPLMILGAAGGMGSVVGTSFGAFIVDSSVTAGIAPGRAGLMLAFGSLCGVTARIGYGCSPTGGTALC